MKAPMVVLDGLRDYAGITRSGNVYTLTAPFRGGLTIKPGVRLILDGYIAEARPLVVEELATSGIEGFMGPQGRA